MFKMFFAPMHGLIFHVTLTSYTLSLAVTCIYMQKFNDTTAAAWIYVCALHNRKNEKIFSHPLFSFSLSLSRLQKPMSKQEEEEE